MDYGNRTLDDKQDTAFLVSCWCLSVADHAMTVTVASINDPPCGKSSKYLLPDIGSIQFRNWIFFNGIGIEVC